MVDGDELVRPRFQIPKAALCDVQLDPIAIPPGLAGEGSNPGGRFDFAEPPQLFHENRLLGGELVLVRRMLVVAASATPENRARRRRTIGRRLDEFHHASAHHRRLFLLGPDSDSLARQHEWGENDASFDPREAISAVDEFLDSEEHVYIEGRRPKSES